MTFSGFMNNVWWNLVANSISLAPPVFIAIYLAIRMAHRHIQRGEIINRYAAEKKSANE